MPRLVADAWYVVGEILHWGIPVGLTCIGFGIALMLIGTILGVVPHNALDSIPAWPVPAKIVLYSFGTLLLLGAVSVALGMAYWILDDLIELVLCGPESLRLLVRALVACVRMAAAVVWGLFVVFLVIPVALVAIIALFPLIFFFPGVWIARAFPSSSVCTTADGGNQGAGVEQVPASVRAAYENDRLLERWAEFMYGLKNGKR
jgi:hypothetical protein